MGLASWILAGAIVGLWAHRFRPRTFPLRLPGTMLGGVLGGALGGFSAAAAAGGDVAGFGFASLAVALVGAVVVVALVGAAGRPRDPEGEPPRR